MEGGGECVHVCLCACSIEVRTQEQRRQLGEGRDVLCVFSIEFGRAGMAAGTCCYHLQ